MTGKASSLDLFGDALPPCCDDCKPGKFPPMTASARAAVLAVLLASEDMTGIESIFENRKIGLSTVIRALVIRYRWPIERRDFPTNTGDGRAGWASTWSLPQEAIDAALDAGGRDWLEGVKAARALVRTRLRTRLRTAGFAGFTI